MKGAEGATDKDKEGDKAAKEELAELVAEVNKVLRSKK